MVLKIRFGDVMKDKKYFYDRFIEQFLVEKQNCVINKFKQQRTCITFDEQCFNNNWDVFCYCVQNKYDDVVISSLLWQLENFCVEEEEKIAYLELNNIFNLCKQYILNYSDYTNESQDIIAKYLQNNIIRIARFSAINNAITKQLLKDVTNEVVNRTIDCLKNMPPVFCDEYDSLYCEYSKEVHDGNAIYDEYLFYNTLDQMMESYLEDVLEGNAYSKQIKYALLMQNIDCGDINVDRNFNLLYDERPVIQFLQDCLYDKVSQEPFEDEKEID